MRVQVDQSGEQDGIGEVEYLQIWIGCEVASRDNAIGLDQNGAWLVEAGGRTDNSPGKNQK